MQQGRFDRRDAIAVRRVPLFLGFLGKLVLEVLPATLASVIGGLLFAHYQFGQPATPRLPTEAASPASAEMMRLVHDEHALIQDFLSAQRAAEQRQLASANAADARAREDAKLAEAARHRAETALAATRPAPPHGRAIVAAADAPPLPAPAPNPLVVAQAQQTEIVPPVAPPASAPVSLVAATLALPGHVVAATLHAVSAIGGIPSWFGHRFGDEPDIAPREGRTAS
jgi:hypothetical protein